MRDKETKPPDFNEEQRLYLARLLRPLCCHTTGTHDPKHFATAPNAICDLQASHAWDHIVAELGLRELIGRAVSSPACGWCSNARQRAKQERILTGLPPLESVLRSFAEMSNRARVREPKKPRIVVAQQDGKRIYVEYVWFTGVQDVGDCSRVHLKAPEYDPAAEIPEDGMPAEYVGFSGDDRDKIQRVLREAGATVLETWGGGTWLSVAIANVTVQVEAAA